MTSPGDLRIRRATVDDAATIAEIAERLFVRTFEPDNDPINVAAHVRESFGESIQREELANPAVTYLLANAGENLVAFAKMTQGSTNPYVVGELPVEIDRFYVDHEYHGSGVASQLMDACIATARELGRQTIWLGVWERNPRAIRFYEKRGFVDVGGKTFMMGSDLQSDRVMMQSISHASAAAAADPSS